MPTLDSEASFHLSRCLQWKESLQFQPSRHGWTDKIKWWVLWIKCLTPSTEIYWNGQVLGSLGGFLFLSTHLYQTIYSKYNYSLLQLLLTPIPNSIWYSSSVSVGTRRAPCKPGPRPAKTTSTSLWAPEAALGLHTHTHVQRQPLANYLPRCSYNYGARCGSLESRTVCPVLLQFSSFRAMSFKNGKPSSAAQQNIMSELGACWVFGLFVLWPNSKIPDGILLVHPLKKKALSSDGKLE